METFCLRLGFLRGFWFVCGYFLFVLIECGRSTMKNVSNWIELVVSLQRSYLEAANWLKTVWHILLLLESAWRRRLFVCVEKWSPINLANSIYWTSPICRRLIVNTTNLIERITLEFRFCGELRGKIWNCKSGWNGFHLHIPDFVPAGQIRIVPTNTNSEIN